MCWGAVVMRRMKSCICYVIRSWLSVAYLQEVRVLPVVALQQLVHRL